MLQINNYPKRVCVGVWNQSTGAEPSSQTL